MISKEQSKPVVDDGTIAISFQGTALLSMPKGKNGDVYVQMHPRYKPSAVICCQYHISLSGPLDITQYTPKTLRDYLQAQFNEVNNLPAIVERYGHLMARGDASYLRARLYEALQYSLPVSQTT